MAGPFGGPIAGPGGCACCSTSVTVTFSGTLKGCNGLSGIVITLVDHASGTPLGTVTTAAGGLYSGSVTVASVPSAVDFTTTGVPRFADSTTAETLHSGANAIGTITLTPAAGYHCWTTTSQCAYPLKDSMQKGVYVINGGAPITGTNPFIYSGALTNWNDGASSLSASTGSLQMSNGSCVVNLGPTPDAGTLICPTTTAAAFTAKWTLNATAGACAAHANSITLNE